jgi:hypothetical protein
MGRAMVGVQDVGHFFGGAVFVLYVGMKDKMSLFNDLCSTLSQGTKRQQSGPSFIL